MLNEKRLKDLKNVRAIQCSKGNFDQDEYSRGYANGLILAVAIMEDKDPKFIEEDSDKKTKAKGSEKKRDISILLAIFLGGLGIHKFYLGKNIQGIFYLLFCWTYIPLFLGIMQGIFWMFYSEERFSKMYNK